MVTAADIRVARAFVDETQAQFAKRLNVDRTAISRWESGELPSGPALILLERIIDDLGRLPTKTTEAAE